MSENAPPPIGPHPDWLPFIPTVVELALRQVGDLDQAMNDAISAMDSGVPVLMIVRGVRRLRTSTDRLKIQYPAYWDDAEQKRVSGDWREETEIELITIERDREHREREHREPVLLFAWRSKLEEFLGLRPAVTAEAKESEQKSAKRRTKRAKQPTRRITQKQRMLKIALHRLREKHPKEYSDGFSGAEVTTLKRQIERIWPEVCKGEDVSPEDYSPPKWDMVDEIVAEIDDEIRRRPR